MSEFRSAPEIVNQKNIENLRVTSELSENVSRILTTDNAKFIDGVLFSADGEEVDDPEKATATGSIGYRVVEYNGAPIAFRITDYRTVPRNLYLPPGITKTQIILPESPTPSIKTSHFLQITAVEKIDGRGNKRPVGTAAHYLVRQGDGFARKSVEPDKEARLLGRALAITHKLV